MQIRENLSLLVERVDQVPGICYDNSHDIYTSKTKKNLRGLQAKMSCYL